MNYRVLTVILSSLVLSACNPGPTAEERRAAAQASIEALEGAADGDLVFNVGNRALVVAPENFVAGDPASRTPPFEVVVTAPRSRALVRPINARASVGQIEDAARQRTGCAATADANVYAMASNRRNVLLTGAELRSVGFRVPVTLTCG